MPKERVRTATKEQVSQSGSPYPCDLTSSKSSDECANDILMTSHLAELQEAMNQTNLIVNYLPQSMTQEDIRMLFVSVGEMESCKLIRDKSTGQSLGYAFVNYKQPESAGKAIASFNGLRLQNKSIKVSFARPSSDLIKGANLYISGLSKNMTSQELTHILAPFGQIITSRVLCDPHTGISKGVGFIRFNLKAQAEEAIKQLNGTIPSGCSEPITVKFANQPTLATSYKAQANAQALQQSIALQQCLSSPLNTVVLNPTQLYQTLQQHTSVFRGSPVTASQVPAAQVRESFVTRSNQTWCLFVFNLPPSVDDNFLLALFAQFGPIQSAKVVRESGTVGKSKGFGFVNMLKYEDCLSAIAALDGCLLDANHVIRVSFKKSPPADTVISPGGILSEVKIANDVNIGKVGLSVQPDPLKYSSMSPTDIATSHILQAQAVPTIPGAPTEGYYLQGTVGNMLPSYIAVPPAYFNSINASYPCVGYAVI